MNTPDNINARTLHSGDAACTMCGKKYVASTTPCPDGIVGCLVAHFVLKPDCECGPPETASAKPADANQRRMRVRAEFIANAVASMLTDCPPLAELAGTIHIGLDATEPELEPNQPEPDDILAMRVAFEAMVESMKMATKIAASHNRLLDACKELLESYLHNARTADGATFPNPNGIGCVRQAQAAIDQAPGAAEGGGA